MNTGVILGNYYDFMRALPPDARQAVCAALAAAGTVTIMIWLYLVPRILREGRRAYRETQERQKEWHPDPAAERAEVAEIRRRKARTELQIIERHLSYERRQALQEAAARREQYQRRAAQEAQAAQAAGVAV